MTIVGSSGGSATLPKLELFGRATTNISSWSVEGAGVSCSETSTEGERGGGDGSPSRDSSDVSAAKAAGIAVDTTGCAAVGPCVGGSEGCGNGTGPAMGTAGTEIVGEEVGLCASAASSVGPIDGSQDGSQDGSCDGPSEGVGVGKSVAAWDGVGDGSVVGLCEGESEGACEGSHVGSAVIPSVGSRDPSARSILNLGEGVILKIGDLDGRGVIGVVVGDCVGTAEGASDGASEGANEGQTVENQAAVVGARDGA